MKSSSRFTSSIVKFSRVVCAVITLIMSLASAHAGLPAGGLTWSMAFDMDAIGAGSVSTLTYTITNLDGGPVENVAFANTLPAGVTLATPAMASTDCDGATLTAADGGSVISFSGGRIGAVETCTVTVNVTSAVPGVHSNTTGDLTSDWGNSGSATANLTVAVDRPGFSMQFSPSVVQLGNRSRVTFTIDNSANAAIAGSLRFSNPLPAGLVIASPANLVTDCVGASVTALPGSSLITMSDGNIVAGLACTVSVDVIAEAVGLHENLSGELTTFSFSTFQTLSCGKASATLEVPIPVGVFLQKSFTDDPVTPGGQVTLEYKITNYSRSESATNIRFTDNLDQALTGLVAIGLPQNDICGSGSQISGTSLLSFTGGSLAPGASCTFLVTLQVPVSAASGQYFSAASTILSGDALGILPPEGGEAGDGEGSAPHASDLLFVSSAPVLTVEFTDDPSQAGGATTLELTVTNPSPTSASTDIAFTLELDSIMATALTVPGNGGCGPGSIITFTPLINPPGNPIIPAKISVSGGSLSPAGQAGDSCVLTFVLNLNRDAPSGVYSHTTSVVSATVDGNAETGIAASDDLVVVAGPSLRMSFIDDPVQPGGTVTIEYTLIHSETAETDATNIGFTHDLDATLSGLVATGLPQNDVCGSGSQLSGTSVISFTGGTLAPGESCTFTVTAQVPGDAVSKIYDSTTSEVTASVSGLTPESPAVSDTLLVTDLTFTQEWIGSPYLPGEVATLRVAFANNSGTLDVSGMIFTQNLGGFGGMLSGMKVFVPIPYIPPTGDLCGAGSALSGSELITFTGGNISAGESCSFDIEIQIPANAADGGYNGTTSNLFATIDGTQLILPPATSNFVVSSERLQLTKSFINDPVKPGSAVTLEYKLTNLDGSSVVTDIAFTDDFDTALTGLSFDSLLANDTGGSVAGVGTGQLVLTGGSLAAGATATIRVSLNVPGGAGAGVYPGSTSSLTGKMGGLDVVGSAASDDLLIQNVTFTAAFSSAAAAGGAATLNYTITNLDATNPVTGLAFSVDLDAALSGMVMTGGTQNDPCGVGSQLSGTSFVTLTGASLAANGSCVLSIPVSVPAAVSPGTYPVTSSGLSSSGLPVALAASADLVVVAPPAFSKSFSPDPIAVGGVSTLTFAIDNSASSLAAGSIDFTDNLPAGMIVATPANAGTTCTGGSLTAVSGSGVIAYTGGLVGAAGSCVVTVDITTSTTGDFSNTSGALTSSLGNSGTASDSLHVNPKPSWTQGFAPNPIVEGGTSTLTFTIDNTGSTMAATDVAFSNTLPSGMTIATPSGATNTCGGTLTATAGAGVLSLSGGSIAAGASCTVKLDVITDAAGDFSNASGDLTSSMGNSGTSSASLRVNPLPGFSKVFASSPIHVGETVKLTLIIDNLGSTVDATGVSFTDNLPAGLVIATPANASTTCTGGTLTAVAGGAAITYSGGTVVSGSSCTVSVDVTATTDGAFLNTTGSLTTSLGLSGSASASLEVSKLVDIVVDVSESIDPVIAGSGVDNLRYTVTVTNNGPSGASNVLVGNVLGALPSGVTLGTVNPSQGIYNVGVWSAGSLAKDASATLTLDLTVSSGAAEATDALSLTSTLTSVTEDQSSTENDSATVQTSIERRVNLRMQIAESIDPVVAGSGDDNLIYTVTLSNDGPSEASGIGVGNVLALPSGVTVGDVTSSQGVYDPATKAWDVGSIVNGENATLVLKLTADSTTAEGTNVVGIVASVTALNEAVGGGGQGLGVNLVLPGDQASERTSVIREVDLVVSVTESIDPVIAGSGTGNLTYLVTINNNGPSDASGVSLDNATVLPSGVSVESVTVSSGSYTGTIWSLGDLANGGSATLTVIVTAGASAVTATDAITNTSSQLTANETLTNTGDDGAAESTSIKREVDIEVSVTESVDPVIAGSGTGNLTYVVTVKNNGPSDASSLSLENSTTLPAGVSIDSSVASVGTYIGTTWNVGDLSNGASATLTIVVTADASAVSAIDAIENVSDQLSVNETETDSSDNGASEATSIDQKVDLIVSVAESIETVIAGSGDENLTYTIEVKNGGPSDASGVELEQLFTLPAGVSIISTTPSQGSYANLIWSVGSLAVNETATLVVVMTVASNAAEGVDVIACQSTVNPPNEGLINTAVGDSAKESTDVAREVDLALSVAESLDPVIAGYAVGNLTHTVTVVNQGPSDSSGVAIDLAQVFPAGVIVESITPSGSATFAGSTWTLPVLANGASESLTVVMTVPANLAGGTDLISSTASLAAVNEPETNAADNVASESTSILSAQSVSLMKLTVRPELSLQTGLFVHQVTVTNGNANDIASMRLYIHGLPADVRVWNASGSGTHNGIANVPYIVINQVTTGNGGSQVVTIEYFRSNRDGNFDPVYIVEIEYDQEDENPNPAGPTQDPLSVTQLPDNGGFMLEWASVVGSEYAVQYSDDSMVTWKTTAPTLTAFANKTQWVDAGLPKTSSHPSTVGSRYYRIVTLETAD